VKTIGTRPSGNTTRQLTQSAAAQDSVAMTDTGRGSGLGSFSGGRYASGAASWLKLSTTFSRWTSGRTCG